MKSRFVTASAILAGLACTGWLLRDVDPVQDPPPIWRLDSRWSGAGQGTLVAVLGGFRSVAADVAWLKMSAAWERRDAAATESWLRLVTVIDPAPLYFWINGARIIAYDLPTWCDAPAEVPARRALALLDEAMRFHPGCAALWVERANTELHCLGDVRAAATSYRRAWEQPNAPYYAGRLHAELLRRLGEKSAALAWLVKLHPKLPPANEFAGAGLVLTRIRELERELGISAERAYSPLSF